jgi:hypothetical protein
MVAPATAAILAEAIPAVLAIPAVEDILVGLAILAAGATRAGAGADPTTDAIRKPTRELWN